MAEYRLRAMGAADVDDVLRWRNADPVRRRMYSAREISPDEHAAWWARSQADPQTRLMVFEHSGIACAVVSFTRYTGADGSATLAFYGDPGRQQRRIAAQLELASFEYAFETLRVSRLEGEVIGFNRSVAQFHLRQGARLEGSRRHAYVRDGIAHDVYYFGMLREDWLTQIGPTLRMRAAAGEAPPDWTGHTVRLSLAIPDSPIREAAMALEVATRLRDALPVGPARLASQSLTFASGLCGRALSLRARVATHMGTRILWSVRLLQGDGLIAEGWFEFRLSNEGDDL